MSADDNIERDTLARLASAGRVAAGFAHELGNPLCAITNYAHSLEEKVAPELRPIVEALQREVARIQRMMDGITDYARPRESGALGADVNVALADTLRFLTDQGVLRPELVAAGVVRGGDRADPDRFAGLAGQELDIAGSACVDARQAVSRQLPMCAALPGCSLPAGERPSSIPSLP